MTQDAYALLDLERTISTGTAYYWREGRRGYTDDKSKIGWYSDEEAHRISEEDVDNLTVPILARTFKRLSMR